MTNSLELQNSYAKSNVKKKEKSLSQLEIKHKEELPVNLKDPNKASFKL
jgi:hypothetical protein